MAKKAFGGFLDPHGAKPKQSQRSLSITESIPE